MLTRSKADSEFEEEKSSFLPLLHWKLHWMMKAYPRICWILELQKCREMPEIAEFSGFSTAAACWCPFPGDKSQKQSVFLHSNLVNGDGDISALGVNLALNIEFSTFKHSLPPNIQSLPIKIIILFSTSTITWSSLTRWESDQQPSERERGQQRQHSAHPSSKGETLLFLFLKLFLKKQEHKQSPSKDETMQPL